VPVPSQEEISQRYEEDWNYLYFVSKIALLLTYLFSYKIWQFILVVLLQNKIQCRLG